MIYVFYVFLNNNKFSLQMEAAPKKVSKLPLPPMAEETDMAIKRTSQIFVQMYLNGSFPASEEEWLQVGIAIYLQNM